MKLNTLVAATMSLAALVSCTTAPDAQPKAAASAASAAAAKVVRIDPSWKAIRDISASTCSPFVGYAGSLEGDDCKTYFETDREATARAFRLAGARFVRQWSAVDHWQLGAGATAQRAVPKVRDGRFKLGRAGDSTDMKNVFSFYKEYGIKVMLTLENYSVYTNAYALGDIDFKSYTRMADKSEVFGKSSDIKWVKKVICDYVRWIVENGFTGVVAGLELGNEPYGQPVNNAPVYAERWTPIVNEIREIWPKAPIGIAIGEYFENDPDVKAIRDRALGSTPLRRTTYFSASEFNRWSARYIVAMSNCLHNIDHVIYHTYGGERPFSATYDGLVRYRNFNRAFPELAGKKMWITEWRDRSDEDNWSHQRFRETLNKTGYMMMMAAQPDIDGMNLHQFTSLSGAFHAAIKGRPNGDGTWGDGTWACHWDGACSWRPNFDDIHKTYLEPGMMGPAMRLMAESFRREPLVIDFGSEKYGAYSEGCSNAVYSCSDYYGDFALRFRRELRSGRRWDEIKPAGDDCEYIVTVNAKRSYMTFLAVNYKNAETRFELRLPPGWRVYPYEYRVYDCPERFLDLHEVPGEPPFTRRYGYQTFNPYFDGRVVAGPVVLEIPANSVTAVHIPIGKSWLNNAMKDEIAREDFLGNGVGAQAAAFKQDRSVLDAFGGPEMKKDAVFPLGEAARQFYAAAAMRAVEQGKLDRVDPGASARELSAVVAKAFGKPVGEALLEEVLLPAGVTNCVFYSDADGEILASARGFALFNSRLFGFKPGKKAVSALVSPETLEKGIADGLVSAEGEVGDVAWACDRGSRTSFAFVAKAGDASSRRHLLEYALQLCGAKPTFAPKSEFEGLPASRR